MQTVTINPFMEMNPSILPMNAQRELYDFYQFLVSKYAAKLKKSRYLNLCHVKSVHLYPF
ncbi:MAG: hypothetical protein DRR16_09505 [Candidatus Parabeggiatoa sp. nov. 3]|nr:MAG: hypothetical protein DRR00_14550 [Gammaproteobacteria bacterium]RKZ67870.1 MAG: hypothetical protein DRQ99_05500 [Gammaproteobacteria bacterium]RKZ86499.1 MAG: hypothetical protein DRR16_09505 [Gammaproteobacteria bacterium]